ncbi:MAG: VOC family protein [Candidatus Azobacteroides sp.]|nr:VOC family protein [Candidatus Azobacteroides sp.]
MEQRITVITLGVADLQRSVRFYEQLGWKCSDKSVGDLIVFDMPGILFALYPIGELAEDVTIPHEPSRFSGITIAHNTHSEEEVAEILAQVETIGGSIVKPAQKTSWGGYSGYFADPDGYIFEVAYNPFWKIE